MFYKKHKKDEIDKNILEEIFLEDEWSILYNKLNRYVSVMAGGAITMNSDELAEFEESQLKAKAMIDVLKNEK